ncbi:hypothetical protein [Elizabethkingia anophelis]|nr:hypothetical protein [Elizabethkingia anophelis]QGN24477.1 hypothetical protein GJV56_18095 [Elizabethkingia anophelis]UTF89270.1 hypothetical protein J2N93_18175 [Elizabethkingia anophelis]UTG00193.1 hypothetical protein J2O04_18390 [Elizabethkingia anophelis]UTG03907.1 hypothetical protein J2O03_18170 [Elizabethkingia anophelis]UTG07650.1 hypothetical protein J2N99_18155 [Elizabethkingia anophelis]
MLTIEEIRKFASKNGYKEELVFFVDFSLTSNKYRLFVIDLKVKYWEKLW